MIPSNGASEEFATSTESTLKRFGTTWPSKPHRVSTTSSAHTDDAAKSRMHIQQIRFSAGTPLIARNNTVSFTKLKFKLVPDSNRLWLNISGEIATSARRKMQNAR